MALSMDISLSLAVSSPVSFIFSFFSAVSIISLLFLFVLVAPQFIDIFNIKINLLYYFFIFFDFQNLFFYKLFIIIFFKINSVQFSLASAVFRFCTFKFVVKISVAAFQILKNNSFFLYMFSCLFFKDFCLFYFCCTQLCFFY